MRPTLLRDRSESVPFRLADACPRLAKARDDYNAWVWQQGIDRRRHADALYRAEKLLAHRELQLIRACDKGNPGYIRKRQAKLAEAQRIVRRYRQEAA